jgi:hypothetical protein
MIIVIGAVKSLIVECSLGLWERCIQNHKRNRLCIAHAVAKEQQVKVLRAALSY